MDEYRRLAQFMDRKATWLKTKQVLALLDNLEKVAPPDWGDWFRHEWPAVLSDISATQTEEEQTETHHAGTHLCRNGCHIENGVALTRCGPLLFA